MDLPNLFSNAPKKDKLYLGLILTEHSVQAMLWKIAHGQINTIRKSKIQPIENDEVAVVQTDLALQELEELSENLSEVLLGLESSWVDEGGIIDTKKPLLKRLTEDLSLDPIGFVVLTEAVEQSLAEKDPQLNALLIFFTDKRISVSQVENGLMQKTESVGRSDNSISDLTEALARFSAGKKKSLPPNIKLISININEDELFEQQQALMEHKWEETDFFVRIPTIEFLPENIVIESVVSQGGKAVAKAQGLEVGSPTPASHVSEANPDDFAFKEVNMPEENGDSLTLKEEIAHDNNLAVPTQSSFGIPISSTKLPEISHIKKHEFPKNDQEEKKAVGKQKGKSSSISKWFKTHRKFALIGFVAGLLALLLLGFGFAAFAGQANINLILNEQNLSKDISITLNPKIAESDFERLIIKSELVSKEFELNQTNETSGVTLVGEKATGKVEVWNKTTSEKSFTAGTNLSSGEIRFTLNEDVTVASASTQEKSNGDIVTTPGKKEATVTAVKIGAEANLNKDTKLNIADFSTSTYEAVALESFSGGSSREIRVVSKEDQSKIYNELKNRILDLADTQYKEDSNADQTFISTGNFTQTSTEYSADIGDENRSLTLTLKGEVEAISYQRDDIKPLAESVLGDLVPEGFSLSTKDPQILTDVNRGQASGSAITVDANISTSAIPQLDLEALKSEIVSKNIAQANSLLDGKNEIKAHTIELVPKIIEIFWKRLPGNPNKINILVE